MVAQQIAHPGWGIETTEQFARLLSFAGYSELELARYLTFYIQRIAPCMENQPTSHRRIDSGISNAGCGTLIEPRSTLTTDGSPIEYSLSFAGSANHPTVRLSFEPDAMSPDPFSITQADQLVKVLATNPEVRTTWFRELQDYFALAHHTPEEGERLLQKAGHRSQIMFGFDFERISPNSVRGGFGRLSSMTPKAYFIPCMAAIQRKQTRWRCAYGAVQRLAETASMQDRDDLLAQLNMIDAYLARYPKESQEGCRYVAVDMVDPADARIKIYLRVQGSTFDQIWDFITLGQQIKYPANDKQSIYSLYQATVGDNGHTADVQREWNREGISANPEHHVKKPMICYFSLQQGKRTPSFKLFIRAQRPYVFNDLGAAEGLMGWMQTQKVDGRAWVTPEDSMRYVELLRDVFPYRSLEDEAGLHCWIAASAKKGKMTVESYFSPEMYKQDERLMEMSK